MTDFPSNALHIIGKALGHESLAATKIYARLQNEPVGDTVLIGTRALIASADKNIPKLLEVRSA